MIYNLVSILACICSLSGNVLINHKIKDGFIVWTFGNILWIATNFLTTPNIPQIIMFVAYAALNVDGYIKWTRGGN